MSEPFSIVFVCGTSTLRSLFERQLKAAGYRVSMHESSSAAITPIMRLRPDVLAINVEKGDVLMEKACQALRQHAPGGRILAVCDPGEDKALRKTIDLDRIVTRPLQPNRLLAELDALLIDSIHKVVNVMAEAEATERKIFDAATGLHVADYFEETCGAIMKDHEGPAAVLTLRVEGFGEIEARHGAAAAAAVTLAAGSLIRRLFLKAVPVSTATGAGPGLFCIVLADVDPRQDVLRILKSFREAVADTHVKVKDPNVRVSLAAQLRGDTGAEIDLRLDITIVLKTFTNGVRSNDQIVSTVKAMNSYSRSGATGDLVWHDDVTQTGLDGI